jgi:tetratricopeptide (TPR) repeat protein
MRNLVLQAVALLALIPFAWLVNQYERSEKANAHFGRFVHRLNEKRFVEARSEVDAALNLSPRNAYYVSGVGLLYDRMGAKPFDANEYLRGAVATAPDDIRLLEAAAAWYEKAIDLNSDDPSFHHNLGWLRSLLGRREEALEALNEAVVLDAGCALYRASLGLALERFGQPDEAGAAYSAALGLSPALLDSPFFDDYSRRSPVESDRALVSAASYLESSWREHGDVVMRARLGKISLFDTGTDGIGLLRQVTADLPNLSRPWSNLGRALELRGERGEAIRCYEKATFLEPGDYSSLSGLARLYELEGKDQEAIDRYKKAINEWLSKLSSHAYRVQRLYRNAPIIADDVVPEGLLSYTQPAFDMKSTCMSLAGLLRAQGDFAGANHYEDLRKKF